MNYELELFPGQKELSEPLFKNPRDYETFRKSWNNNIRNDLDDLIKRRAESELESRSHLVVNF